MTRMLADDLLKNWYPRVIDTRCGGYYTNLAHDWQLLPSQDKMIVSQARHIWTTSEAAAFYPTKDAFPDYAMHGVKFLQRYMWDHEHGGFYQIRNREGGFTENRGWCNEKRTYGNAFAILALARYYRLTRDSSALDLAKEAFTWLEEHAFDQVHGGYFQFLTREGNIIGNNGAHATEADDKHECGYKDLNSSIHLLEAYTELYRVWRDRKLRSQLIALLQLIRDTMAAEQGYLRLFFEPDWTPLSFREASPKVRMLNYELDHISFGHDFQTAVFLLDASHVAGLENDSRTLLTSQRLIEHAIANGWDQDNFGFFDGGYYEHGSSQCAVIRPTKAGWAQADALNALLLFSHIFPTDRCYLDLFEKQWEYIDAFIVDHRYGDWFEGGLDREPENMTALKGHMWKCTYHTSRVLMNSIALFSDDAGSGVLARRNALLELIAHWKRM
jgi:cellobiose epimerase